MIALTGRQAGKTQSAAWALAHVATFQTGSLSVVACPSQRQSGEAIRRVKAALVKIGAVLKADNVFALETQEGSRVWRCRATNRHPAAFRSMGSFAPTKPRGFLPT